MTTSTSSHRPFQLVHGSIEHTLLVPNELFFNYSQLKEEFTKTLPEPTEGFADDNEPSSPAELYAKFLGFIASYADKEFVGQILKLSLQDFNSRFLDSNNENIHSFAATLLSDDVVYPTTPTKIKDNIIKNYYQAIIKSNTKIDKIESNLLYQAHKGDAKLAAIFGGQGNTDDYFEELRELYKVYGDLIYDDLIVPITTQLNKLVKQDSSSLDKIFTQGLNILSWLRHPETTPDQDYLLSVPVSCPVICIIQLCHYAITCKVLGLTPGEFRKYFIGSTGHSQGLVTAVAIASSDSWNSFLENSIKATSLLFYIGARCLITYPRTTLPPTMLQDSLDHGEGRPSPMLSVRDLTIEQVEAFIKQTNSHLPQEKHIAISLVNGARNLVVSGPPESLYGFNLNLRNKKAPNGLDQSRIPFSERKLKCSNRFLPIFAPFHSHLLADATETILEDVSQQNLNFKVSDLKIPVFDTFDGSNFQDFVENGETLVGRIVKCITELAVHWETSTKFQSTHILDFGPGGVSGLGILTHRNKEGTGARIIVAGALDSNPIDDEYGFKQEIFHHSADNEIKWAPNWLNEYKPTLVKTAHNGKVFVKTKFSQLLGRAPLMVPGMTPTTVNSKTIIASLNAGYHIELAGGGYFAPQGMTAAIDEIVENIKPGYGLGINLIYVNPRMLQWGIPLIKELRDKGYPIQSLTIGAGVPSLEVATEYIETLGLTHLGLKPGSIDAISQVITIAKAHPNFPIVLQWTGGRGGGHHSFEDFHQPILQMYSKIRRCSNIVLVAGSGFGSDEDTYPYLTGSWSNEYNYPAMPFDGILFGSRVMTAKEAETSLEAKKLIATCKGVSDDKWELTYKKPTGGIITVRSEMGEPIHKIATRGVMLWKELDDTIFTQPKNKQLEILNKKKDYIIDKLNKDFQKPWFGKNAQGVCDLQDMTYQEVANRLIELMYVKKSQRWIDISLRNFFGDFLRRVEERFTTASGSVSLIQNYNQLQTSPQQFTDDFFNKFQQAKQQLISEEDCDFFLMCCSRPTQKPAPFVPVLDDRFEFFFKKDSLWQSEDLETVVDEDVQRTCILHGPVAAQFTNKVNEPIGEILDSIHEGHIAKLIKDEYSNDATKIPVVEYFGGSTAPVEIAVENVKISTVGDKTIYEIASNVPEHDAWLRLLAGSELDWLKAFISTDRIVQGSKHIGNQVHDVLKPVVHSRVEIVGAGSQKKLVGYENVKGDLKPVVEIQLTKGNVIQLNLIEHRTADGTPVALPFLYNYNPSDGFAPILEVMTGRNDRIKEFYWKLWFGNDVSYDLNIDVEETIEGEQVTITGQDIAEFTHAIGNNCDAFVTRHGKVTLAPMDFAIVIGWRAIIKAIFPKTVDGDLLKLVHLSNGYKMIPGAAPLKKDDIVSTKAQIKRVVNQASGKQVEVVGTIYREGKPVMEVTSQFLYRGDYTDYENTFQKVTETPVQVSLKNSKDLAVLRSKEWFHLEQDVELLNQTLTFRCESTYKFKTADVYSSIKTTGQIYLELPTKEVVQVGQVDYEAGVSYGNPVTDYLQRNGKTIEEAVKFENVIPISSGEELTSKAPSTNEPYAIVSGDYNPIHVSRVFAAYAKLPGTITHGMYSSANIRALVEQWAANNVAARVRAFKCDFVGMVLPNDTLQTTLEHIGMINGRKIIKVETKNVETDSVVLIGEAEIEQPITAYVFTGQGSQEQGMGMDLYNSSEVAREVWDKADVHFVNHYGFSILDIVQNNPNELTIHFGGAKGRKIRENYITMMFETIGENGELKSEKIFKDIDETTTSYTFVSPTGLLSATQFTQPALTLMEKAAYEDIKSKGLIPSDIMFAGHSLGEYSALSSLANVMPIESLVDVVFYRGMTMQVAVPRDELGRSNYGMCAINPSRVSVTFNDAALRFVVDEVATVTGWLLEIVNYNVENQQYVAAGDLRSLDTLTNVLNVLKLNKIDIVRLQSMMSLEEVKQHLKEIIDECSKKSIAKPQPIDLERGFAVIPLKGISVPFHSSYLRSGVKPFQRFLCKKIPKSSVKPNDLIGKYIPNLTAKPFELTKEYFQDVYELTGSEKIKKILENWESYEKA